MNEEKDFFKTCFNTVAGLEVKNESQAIAKEVVLSEIETLEQQCKKQKKVIDMVSARLEYFLIGNLKYQSSQEEFIKLLNILKEVE